MSEKPVEVKVKRRWRKPVEVEQVVEEFSRSGMKVEEFCAGRDLSRSTLERYLRKQRWRVNDKTGGLVPVELTGAMRGKAGGEKSWAVVLRSGRRIEMPEDWEESRLKRLVDLLERV